MQKQSPTPVQYLSSFPLIIKEIGWIQINDSPLMNGNSIHHVKVE
jgi:hypothetical protein